MSDTYQAIYDATRSRMSNGDIGHAIESVVRDANLSHYVQMAFESVRMTAGEYERPSIMLRPSIAIDGNQWCVLYGENLQDGVAGFGDSPEKAMRAFDCEWHKSLSTQEPTP